jgi:type IV secretory pathway VirB10-like protein
MHRLSILAAALAVVGAVLAGHGSADAQQRKKQANPSQPPKVIIERDRRLGPPQQPEPRYYGPAPTIQPPMERVPMPAPLAQPPTNR